MKDNIIIDSSESDKVFFTLIQSVTQVVKTFLADGTKKTAANIFKGKYYAQSVGGLMELDMYLNNLTQFDTIAIGLIDQPANSQ